MGMSNDAKILIVEDEVQINRLIELVLLNDGYYKIKKAYNGKEALDIIKQSKPDLILLDIMIPEIDGYSLCKIIKNDPMLESIQIIMLTAKKMEEDILQGFEQGAIDYITKPFNNKILLARIKAHLANSQKQTSKYYENLLMDRDKRIVKLDNKEIKLTYFEFEILTLFINNPGRVYSRTQLLQHLRGDGGYEVSERAMDVQILNLRRKLGHLGTKIETIRNVGYKLKESYNE